MIGVIVLTILVFVTWLLISNKLVRYILGTLSTLCLLILVIGIVANMNSHWGMKKETVTTKNEQIYTAGQKRSPAHILIANEIGNKSNNYVMAYRNHTNDDKPKAHFKPNTDKSHLAESVKKTARYQQKNVDKATVKTKKTYWTWKSSWYQHLFSFNGDSRELITQKTTVTIPKDTWVVLNAQQLKQLQKQSTSSNAQQQKAQKAEMAKKMASYKQQHSNVSKQQMKDYQQHLMSEMAVKQIKQQLKN
jgi:hypothetical protein